MIKLRLFSSKFTILPYDRIKPVNERYFGKTEILRGAFNGENSATAGKQYIALRNDGKAVNDTINVMIVI